MLKYRFLYKEYLIRTGIMLFFFLALIFLQCGLKKVTNNIDELYMLKFSDIFVSIQFAIPLLLIDNYKVHKEESIRYNKNIIIIAIERIIITIVMVTIIRIIALLTYNLVVFHNANCFKLIGRFMIIDIASIMMSYILFNVFLNRYVGMIISFIISIVLFNFKMMYFSVLKTKYVNETITYKNIDIIYYASLFFLIMVLIMSLFWRKEYVSD